MRSLFISTPLLALSVALAAADQAPPVVPPAPQPGLQPAAEGPSVFPAPAVPGASPWTTKGRFGAFFANSTTKNADTSRDATIGGTARTTTFLLTADFDAEWKEGKDSVQQIFKGRYGRQKTNDQPVVESDDEARYDGVYRRELTNPHFVYLGWGLESVWTGPYPNDPTRAPDNSRNNFDPLLAKVSGGYGQRYADWVPQDKFEWRLGARAQKRWGSLISSNDRGIETGIEAFARYEGVPATYQKDLKYFAQYEGFSEFNDLKHITNLITAGLTFQLSKYINIDLALRAYYETLPKEYDNNSQAPGYNQWSIKQDTMVGVVYSF